MRLVAFTFSIGLPGVLGVLGVPESWESQSLGSLGSPGVLGVSGVPESQTVNCTFADNTFLKMFIKHPPEIWPCCPDMLLLCVGRQAGEKVERLTLSSGGKSVLKH